MSKEILDKIKSKQQVYNYVKNNLGTLKVEKESLIASLASQEEDKSLLDNILYACKLILEKLTYNSKTKLEHFITYALQNIFTDRNYQIKLSIKEDTKNPGIELTLVEDGIEQEITDAVGGGILSTLGLLLQIYYIEVYNLRKIMFIDEGLKEVSTGHGELSVNYLDNVLKFLKWLSEEKDYTFVIVTHDNRVRQFADRVYEVKKGELILCH